MAHWKESVCLLCGKKAEKSKWNQGDRFKCHHCKTLYNVTDRVFRSYMNEDRTQFVQMTEDLKPIPLSKEQMKKLSAYVKENMTKIRPAIIKIPVIKGL